MNTARLSRILQREKAGFRHIRAETEKVLHKLSAAACLELADEMYASPVHQERMFAVLLWSSLAVAQHQAYESLKTKVVGDDNWRVQEILARAFDQYCKDRGYAQSLPTIREWLRAKHPNQRRAVSEGLRIWTNRPYFNRHPTTAIRLLSGLRSDESEYVRRSAGNALRDISKRFPELVRDELDTWDITEPRTQATYKLAGKLVSPSTNQ